MARAFGLQTCVVVFWRCGIYPAASQRLQRIPSNHHPHHPHLHHPSQSGGGSEMHLGEYLKRRRINTLQRSWRVDLPGGRGASPAVCNSKKRRQILFARTQFQESQVWKASRRRGLLLSSLASLTGSLSLLYDRLLQNTCCHQMPQICRMWTNCRLLNELYVVTVVYMDVYSLLSIIISSFFEWC